MRRKMNFTRPLKIAFICAFAASSFLAMAQFPAEVNGQVIPSLAPMLDRTTPAVVSVQVAGTHISKQRIPEMYRYFFGPNTPREQIHKKPFKGIGSGVIINAAEGHIITNHHVIQSADEIIIGLHNGRELHATVIGSDPQTDIALLKVDAENLIEIKQSNSDQLRVGDFVVAIGNPFGLGQTVTSGIISALGRSGLGIERLENFIQTDAAINTGNSGGALVNIKGELVGINTAIVAPGGGNIGIGFAIPINMANNLVKQIIQYGEARRGWLGISGYSLTTELAKTFGLNHKHGVFISEVSHQSAAQKAGLKAGDIIVSLNKKPIKNMGALRAHIATLGAGYKIQLGIIREGRNKNFSIILLKPKEQKQKSDNNRSALHRGLTGALLQSHPKGIIVNEIKPNSPAYNNGLKVGDIIIGVNKFRVNDLQAFTEILKNKQQTIALNIQRENSHLYLVLR